MVYDVLGNMPRPDFSGLTKIVPTYEAAQQNAREDELRKALAGGLPRDSAGQVDWNKVVDLAAKSGNVGGIQNILQLAPLAKLSEERAAAAQFNAAFGIPSAGAAPAATPAAASGPLVPGYHGEPARPPVPSSSKVIGDAEAEAARLYETPPGTTTRMAQNPNAPAAPRLAPELTSPTPLAAVPPTGAAPPAITTNPASQNIGRLIAAASDPRLPAQQQMIAKTMLEHALRTSDLPQEQKNYLFYRAQGGTKPFFDYQKELKVAPATVINTGEGFEAAQRKARVALDQEAIKNLAQQAVQGQTVLPLLDQIYELADKTPGGWAGTASPALARAISGLGFPVPEKLSNAELLASASRQLIPGVRDPGSVSNLEQTLYAQAVPGLANSVEGRKKLTSMFRAMVQRRQEIVDVYRKHIGDLELSQELAKLHNKPMFNEEERNLLIASTGGRAAAPAAAPALPPGVPPPPPGFEVVR